MSISLHTRFTEGDCHVLARAIHEATGWKIATFAYVTGCEPTHHAFAQMPNGDYIDIDGVSTEKQMMERWFEREPMRNGMFIITFRNICDFRDSAPDWCDEINWPASPALAISTAHRLLWKHCNA